MKTGNSTRNWHDNSIHSITFRTNDQNFMVHKWHRNKYNQINKTQLVHQ